MAGGNVVSNGRMERKKRWSLLSPSALTLLVYVSVMEAGWVAALSKTCMHASWRGVDIAKNAWLLFYFLVQGSQFQSFAARIS
jgi:hypothetical protein